MSIFNIQSWADFRAFLYVLLPVISTLLVAKGFLTDASAQLWTGLVTAILGPVIAAFMARTVSTTRTAIYALIAAGQALVVAYGLATGADFATWMPLVVVVVGAAGSGVAAANTDTTPAAGS